MGKDTFIGLAFILLFKKKYLFCKLQLFSQNTEVLHFPENFYIYQRSIANIITCRDPKKSVICSKLTMKNLSMKNVNEILEL